MKLEVLDRAISATLTVAVILIAVVLIRREFWKDSTLGGPTLETEPKYIDDWGNRVDEELLFRMGQDDAQTQITVFFDLECPFCGRFHESVILPLLADRPNDVSVAFVDEVPAPGSEESGEARTVTPPRGSSPRTPRHRRDEVRLKEGTRGGSLEEIAKS